MGAHVIERRACVVVCAVAVWLFAFSTSALAGFTHPFVSSFGSFSNVQGVAVDSSTGDVYVYDGGNGEVLKFDASGAPAEFSSTKTNSITGAGTAASGEGEIAVDNSSGPAKGDIYIAHAAGSINIFDAAGEKISELTEGAGAPWGEACGVAVDASGNVYVGLYSEHINKYVPSANPVTNADYASSIGGLSGVCNVGADAAGDAYAITWPNGPVTRYEPGQFGSLSGTGSIVDAKGSSLAVDPAGDDVYVDEQDHVVQFGAHGEPFGEPVGTFASSGPGAISGSVGIAVSAFNGDVYVANGQGAVSVFGPGVVLADVVTGEASNVQPESATVSGTINPNGVALSACNFEYGSSASYGQSQACAETPGEIGAGASPVEVHADLTGLTPGTIYHYRLAGANANGAGTGGDRTFIAPGPPSVSAESVVTATRTEAEVEAKINPEFSAAAYHVDYGPSNAYGNTTPQSAPVGSDGSDHTVSTRITGLTPGATYHFRFVATNAVGATQGADSLFATYPPQPSSADTCPNADVRASQSAAYLPDCRAYELVSPPNKDGSNVAVEETFTQSAVNGNAVKWTSNRAFGDAVGAEVRGAEYISQRNAEGWVTHAINPRQTIPTNDPVVIFNSSEYQAFSDDLTKGVYYALSPLDTNPNVHEVPNLYLRRDVLSSPSSGSYELLSDSAAPLVPNDGTAYEFETRFTAASADFSHITFESIYDLTADAAGTNSTMPKLYEWHNGIVTLVGVLPNGGAAEGSTAGQGASLSGAYTQGGWTQETISSDGSRIVFTAPPFSYIEATEANFAGNLYMRIDGIETVQVNVDERSEPDPNGPQPATFWKATSDESQVFFTTRQALTNDATPGYVHFYRFDVEAPVGKRLTLLTQGRLEPPLGRPIAAVNGISADGSYVYFTFNSPLREVDPRAGGLYVWHEGSLRFLAKHAGSSNVKPEGWGEGGRYAHYGFRVTQDGKTALFESSEPEVAQLVGYNDEAESSEIYLYNYDSDKLVCVSCDPSGAPPTGIGATFTTNGLLDAHDLYPAAGFMAVNMYLDRALSEDGRYVFFDTSESLVPEDSNGRRDVYEYDTSTGRVQLISGGSCNCDSAFVDATPDGSNVFFITHQSLVRADWDTGGDVYDARVNGGIASQNVIPPAPCEGDDCQGPAKAAPSSPVPSSAMFAGGGNPPGAPQAQSTHRTLTRARKLARALQACRAKRGKRRARCEAQARKRYGAHRSGNRASRRAGR